MVRVKQVRPHPRQRAGRVAPKQDFDAHRKLHADNHVSPAASAARLHATRDLLGAPIPEEGP